jgi:hypothetical protein
MALDMKTVSGELNTMMHYTVCGAGLAQPV